MSFEGCYFVFGLMASRDGRTRTGDLLGMSQASSQLLHIAMAAAGVAVAAAYEVREEVTWRFHTSFSLIIAVIFG